LAKLTKHSNLKPERVVLKNPHFLRESNDIHQPRSGILQCSRQKIYLYVAIDLYRLRTLLPHFDFVAANLTPLPSRQRISPVPKTSMSFAAFGCHTARKQRIGEVAMNRNVRRIVIWLLAVVIAVPLIGAGAGYVWWSRGLPKLDGEVQLKGLGADVRVVRDAHGVPHIFAGNMTDAARALGYLHGQDRDPVAASVGVPARSEAGGDES
jgi:hypothetical protein